MIETSVKELIKRYERFFMRSLAGEIAVEEIRSLYASDFIAASPAGGMTGRNDEHFNQAMTEG